MSGSAMNINFPASNFPAQNIPIRNTKTDAAGHTLQSILFKSAVSTGGQHTKYTSASPHSRSACVQQQKIVLQKKRFLLPLKDDRSVSPLNDAVLRRPRRSALHAERFWFHRNACPYEIKYSLFSASLSSRLPSSEVRNRSASSRSSCSVRIG